MSKHFIRLAGDNNPITKDPNAIVHGFSDEFEQPEPDDVFTHESGGRQFEFYVEDGIFNEALGIMEYWFTNPNLLNERQIPLFKRVGEKNVVRSQQEIDDDTPISPEPTPAERRAHEYATRPIIEWEGELRTIDFMVGLQSSYLAEWLAEHPDFEEIPEDATLHYINVQVKLKKDEIREMFPDLK